MPKPTTAQAELLLHLYELRRDPELRQARAWFLTSFQETEWAAIHARYLSHSDEDRWFRMVISYWELVATLVNRGAIHAELFFDHTGEDVVTWERCKPWIAGARAAIRPSYLFQFERLVRDHLAYRARLNAALTRPARGARPGTRAVRAARPARKRGR